MALLRNHPHFRALQVPEGYDGLTTLPSEQELRDFGFTDRSIDSWYYTASVGSGESLNITIPKRPLGSVLLEPVYAYRELVMDEYFGQPAYFGAMREEFRFAIAERISSVLARLIDLGVQIEIDPREYSWKNWPEATPLTGSEEDKELIRGASTP